MLLFNTFNQSEKFQTLMAPALLLDFIFDRKEWFWILTKIVEMLRRVYQSILILHNVENIYQIVEFKSFLRAVPRQSSYGMTDSSELLIGE